MSKIGIFNKKHPLIIILLISLSMYTSFYFKLFIPNYFFGGSDAENKHIPSRVYFYESIMNDHRFPFWTERQYSGFPIYADPENGYLNPINTASIILFGPILSYKIIHLSFYLIGSFSLYFLLKRHKMGLASFCIANLVYFFSFFLLSHTIHFNIETVVLLFPLNILLADLFIERKNFTAILAQSVVLAVGVSWGQIQFVIISALSIFLYLIILGYKKLKLKTFILYNIIGAILVTLLTIPIIVPAFELYSLSSRSTASIFRKGNLTPEALAVTAYPYLLGRDKVHFAEKVKESLSYTETSTYLSICALILALSSLLFAKTNRLKLYLFVNIFIFIIFACVAYIPIKEQYLLVITMFRYWIRTIFLAAFSVGILAGFFVEKFYNHLKFKNIRWNIFLPGVIILYLALSVSLNVNNYDPDFKSSIFNMDYLLHTRDSKVWLIAIGGTIGLILASLINKFYPKFPAGTKKIISCPFKFLRLMPDKEKLVKPEFLRLAFIILVFSDLLYFSQDILSRRIRDISSYIPTKEAVSANENKRIVTRDKNIYGMQFLYYKSWSPFGYSQFMNDKYQKYLRTQSISFANFGNTNVSDDLLKTLGVAVKINPQERFEKVLIKREIDIISNELGGNYIKKQEGYMHFNISNPVNQNIFTYIRSYPGWKLTVNKKKQGLNDKDLFLSFNLPKGEHTIEMEYIPSIFYKSLIVSVTGLSLLGLLYVWQKEKITHFFQ